MAYFEPYIDADGIHIPTYQDTLDELISKYKTIFGDDVYIEEETPDYQLLSVFAKCLDDYAALAVDAYNARNINYASGNSLDIIVGLAGIRRNEATPSTVVLKLSGSEGVYIPKESEVIDENGNIWDTLEDVEIPASGYIEVDAVCETYGAISAPPDTINGIYSPIPGWESVTNEDYAEEGENAETDADLRKRFAEIHALSASGLSDSIVAGLRRIEDVSFVDLVENDTSETDGSTGIPGHSICAIVSGGDEQTIANALFKLKSPGVGTYGGVTKQVLDDSGRINSVSFSRPTQVSVAVTVTILPLVGYDADIVVPIIKSALKNDINNLGIGEPWSVTMGYKDIYSVFNDMGMTFSITSISATNSHGTSTSRLQCDFDEILHVSDLGITIVDS